MGKLTELTASVLETHVVKKNCWEHKLRPRWVDTRLSSWVCPAATSQELSGVHGGRTPAGRAGRSPGLCGARSGTYAQKLLNCWRCEFMNSVKKEEEPTTFGFHTASMESPWKPQQDGSLSNAARKREH
jgi:hypothetical protein